MFIWTVCVMCFVDKTILMQIKVDMLSGYLADIVRFSDCMN